MVKKSLRLLAFMVAVSVVLTLLGACGKNNESAATTPVVGSTETTSASASETKEHLKEVTLKFFFRGDDRPAKADVLQELYNVTKDRLNAKFEFNFIPGADYQNKLIMMQAAGDNYDASFTADWNVYPTMVNKGAYLPLNDLLPKYAPTTYKEYQDAGMINPISVNGQIMALPWTIVKTSKPVFAYRKDIVKKYNISEADVSTIEGIDKLLMDVAKANIGLIPFDLNISGGGARGDIVALLMSKYEYIDIGWHSMYMDINDPSHTVMPLEQTPLFKEAVTLAKKWYDAGVISKDALTNKVGQLYVNGKAFSNKNTAQMLYEVIPFTDKVAENAAVEIYPNNKAAKDSPLNNAMAINKYAANPERALMFFELVNTDQKVYDTLLYGIKDKTYTVDSNGIIGFAPGEDASKPLWQGWANYGFWRDKFQKPTALISTEALKNEKAYAMRPNIIVSPIAGLVPNSDNIKTEIAKRDQLLEEQGKLLLTGIVTDNEIDKAINDYIQKQNDAGLDKILKDVQAQVDAFIKK